jgi:uncharacterized protein
VVIEVVLESVRVHKELGKYVLLLREKEGPRYLPLWVGQTDADAASRAVKSESVPRPQPHDLMLEAVRELGGRCSHAAIIDLVGKTYYAQLVVEQAGRQVELDARPSDAVNVALRARVPNFAEERLLAELPPKKADIEGEAPQGGSAQQTE